MKTVSLSSSGDLSPDEARAPFLSLFLVPRHKREPIIAIETEDCLCGLMPSLFSPEFFNKPLKIAMFFPLVTSALCELLFATETGRDRREIGSSARTDGQTEQKRSTWKGMRVFRGKEDAVRREKLALSSAFRAERNNWTKIPPRGNGLGEDFSFKFPPLYHGLDSFGVTHSTLRSAMNGGARGKRLERPIDERNSVGIQHRFIIKINNRNSSKCFIFRTIIAPTKITFIMFWYIWQSRNVGRGSQRRQGLSRFFQTKFCGRNVTPQECCPYRKAVNHLSYLSPFFQ